MSEKRAKDGAPSWDGNPASYQEYEESRLLWEQSMAFGKRYLCGPKLAAELTGAAKRLVAGRPADWLSHPDGVRRLMDHLRTSLGKPQIAELTERLSRFFKGSRRRTGKSMNDYIASHTASEDTSQQDHNDFPRLEWIMAFQQEEQQRQLHHAGWRSRTRLWRSLQHRERRARRASYTKQRLQLRTQVANHGATETGKAGAVAGKHHGGTHLGTGGPRTMAPVGKISGQPVARWNCPNSSPTLCRVGISYMTPDSTAMRRTWYRQPFKVISR